MDFELGVEEIIYKFKVPENIMRNRDFENIEYSNIYGKIKSALEIDKFGYNVYLIDNFSKEKVQELIDYIESLLKKHEKPKDICYVVYEDEKKPSSLFLLNGNGVKLKRAVEDIQKRYTEFLVQFYSNSSNKEKEDVMNDIHKRRNELVSKLVDMAKKDGFDVKPTASGFSFVPLKDGQPIAENEYEMLDFLKREDIIDKIGALKSEAQNILKELKKAEADSLDKIKEIMRLNFNKERNEIINSLFKDFIDDKAAADYLYYVMDNAEKNIVENYTMSFEEDEEKIDDILFKYNVNVLVDNSENEYPQVIFEEDPNVINLLGTTNFENHNGTYTTDISLIETGSILKANGGCLILRVNSLFANPSAYYHIKKTLLSEKINMDYNRGYLELLSLNSIKPEPIKVNTKIILIGDDVTYDVLFNNDEDFKELFKVRVENDPILPNNEDSQRKFTNEILRVIKDNNLKMLSNEAIKELAKYHSRKAGDKRKLMFDFGELSKVLIFADQKAAENNRSIIEIDDISNVIYIKELIQTEILENYKDKKIIFNTTGEIIGSINGLSVIDVGYHSFGKPLRITCNCYKGNGEIIDAHKESNLSGQIHHKSISILKGYLNKILGGYNNLHVDFHLSFEQLYGKIEGDSASVAEMICMISALSKLPIKQNIAVTGSINLFGEVQPIGGVNEKIEGFYNVCNILEGHDGKGVLIPYSNKDELLLNSEIEEAIVRNEFHIYTMKTMEEAMEILIGNEKCTLKDIYDAMDEELEKYCAKKS